MATAETSAELAWPGAPAAAVGQTAAWIGSWDAATGGDFLFGVEISNSPSALALGEVYYIAAGGLVYTQTLATAETDGVGQDALRGRLGRRCWCDWNAVLPDTHRRNWHQRS